LVDLFRSFVYRNGNCVDEEDERKGFHDIYFRNKRMKLSDKGKRFLLYLWIGSAFLVLWLISDLAKYPQTFPARVLNECWRLVYVTALNYFLFEYSWPYIRRKRRTILLNLLLAIPVLFIHLMLYSWGLWAWRFVGIGVGIYTPLKTFSSAEAGVTNQMSYSMSSVFFFGIVRHIYDHIKLRQAAQQLRIEKQQAELNYLKSQTNPHFLFNTLNNIYSLARDKSDQAPESILRLSKLLRYMLYETSGDYIAIEQELKMISDYIALEKLRYDETLRINFNYDVEDLRQALPPLLLIPLVENAFKHGVSETRGRPSVDIHLSVKNRRLVYVVKNSTEEASSQQGVKENIGLSNLRRQLQLLYKEYELSVQQQGYEFVATLTINLASHV
jgi:sensor histidine kinase YesM